MLLKKISNPVNKSTNKRLNNKTSNNKISNKTSNNKISNKTSNKTLNNKKQVEFSQDNLEELRKINLDSDLRNINNYLKTKVLTQKKINDLIKGLKSKNKNKKILIYNKFLNDLEKIKNKYINNILKLFEYKENLKEYLKNSEILQKYSTKPNYKLVWTQEEKEIEKNLYLNETQDLLDDKYTTNYNLELFKYVCEIIFKIRYDDLKGLSEFKNEKTKRILITSIDNE